MIRPDETQLRNAIDEMRGVLDDLELGILDRSKPGGKRWSLTVYELLARARVRSKDKLPGPERGRGAIGGHGDPTCSEAASRVEDHDEDLRHWHELLTDLEVARTYLRRLPAHLRAATPAQQHPDRPNLECCRVCSRKGDEPAIYRAERCQWCYRFWLDWKVDAPEPILKLRREGKPVSENAIRAAIEETEAA